jgi:hypothetical protein
LKLDRVLGHRSHFLGGLAQQCARTTHSEGEPAS